MLLVHCGSLPLVAAVLESVFVEEDTRDMPFRSLLLARNRNLNDKEIARAGSS